MSFLGAATGCAPKRMTADAVYFPPRPVRARVVHLKSFNSLHDIVPSRGSWTDVFRGASPSPYVATPAGIAIRGSHLYICDTGLNTVHDWNLATGNARKIGQSGEVTLIKPVAVAVDRNGIVYVADTGRAEVVAFDENGRSTRTFKPTEKKEYRPSAVAVSDAKLYVADIASHRVDLFSTQDGEHLGFLGGIGSDPGKLYYPTGLGTDKAGNILVSDMMNARVQVFGPDREFLRAMGQPGDRYGDMGKPKHVAVGPDGTIFVADSEFARIHLFDPSGRLLMMLGRDEDGPGQTPMPVGVATTLTLPEQLATLTPDGFDVSYYLFTTNSVGSKRISLYAIGLGSADGG